MKRLAGRMTGMADPIMRAAVSMGFRIEASYTGSALQGRDGSEITSAEMSADYIIHAEFLTPLVVRARV